MSGGANQEPESGLSLPAELLELLACPACLDRLTGSPRGLACTGCGRLYPIIDGIPILLVDQAVPTRCQ